MIPKIIHYCWFGHSEKNDIIKKCIASWKVQCPDYQIIEWNESNFDIRMNDYVSEAYDAGKWAFVSDFCRLYVVKKMGGIYLDTDVELLKNLDELLQYDCFYIYETALNIATGLGFGSVKNHMIVDEMIKQYDGRHFLVNGKLDMTPCPAGNTAAFRKCVPEFRRDNQTTVYRDTILLLSSGDYPERMIHYGTATWVDHFEHKEKKFSLLRKLRKPKIYKFIERKFGKKGIKLYSFLVYDFVDYGLMYYIKRFFRKVKK